MFCRVTSDRYVVAMKLQRIRGQIFELLSAIVSTILSPCGKWPLSVTQVNAMILSPDSQLSFHNAETTMFFQENLTSKFFSEPPTVGERSLYLLQWPMKTVNIGNNTYAFSGKPLHIL